MSGFFYAVQNAYKIKFFCLHNYVCVSVPVKSTSMESLRLLNISCSRFSHFLRKTFIVPIVRADSRHSQIFNRNVSTSFSWQQNFRQFGTKDTFTMRPQVYLTRADIAPIGYELLKEE